MSKNKRTQKNDVTVMSNMLASRIICAMQPAKSYLRWSDNLHMIFVKAVAYQGGPHEAKPTALKETMEAMGVWGLTIQNIKSHLQRYREKCESGAEAPAVEVPGTTSLCKAALNQYDFYLIIFQYFLMPCQGVYKILMDTDAVMLEMEIVNNFLMDDIEMMEKEMMDEIQVVQSQDNEANFSCPQLIEHNL
ncbi:hypothetical protein C2845_PM01G33640 [Panicum miliaceum]|uniref:HTH myb-type domain-containing protein n=1 Tax=Panicum miliaceum TaxID=4540 RepID=A0A3L6TL54_PANMI|nr:hypothetical protein C2845_PM01G33640 [Panicum miliaceum]